MPDPRGYQGWPQIPNAEEFVRLAQSEEMAEYLCAARGWAEEEVWLEVIQRFPDTKASVAHNKTVPLSIFALLADDHDIDVRSTVARRRKLSRELFEKLAKDPAPTIRGCVAGNAKVPTDILEGMLDDPEDWVRMKVAQILAGRSEAKAGSQ